MDLNLTQEGVLVVGAAHGIGHAIAVEFATEGCHVVLADIDSRILTVAETMSRDFPDSVIRGVVLDATDSNATSQLATSIGEYVQALHHVIYAAGAGSGKYGFPFWNMEPQDWKKVLDVNLLGAVNVAHAFAPVLRAHEHGSLLFIASIAAQMGSQTDPPYSAAKAALINFMQVVAKDLAPFHIRANAISPGMIQTTLNRGVWQAWYDQQPEESRMDYEQWGAEKIKKLCPLQRWQSPRDIAQAAVFLASKAAENITGQTLNVDGGIIMHS
ncbi:MAG: SDR family oxidoreductase [Planctomycetota bacterium]|nr:SDR family oxidoreductase [Planctomycetota bacterium]